MSSVFIQFPNFWYQNVWNDIGNKNLQNKYLKTLFYGGAKLGDLWNIIFYVFFYTKFAKYSIFLGGSP